MNRLKAVKPDGPLSFIDHLEELRICTIKCLIAIIIMACFFYSQIDSVFSFLVKPVGKLVFTSPGGAFNARMMLAFLGGAILSSPYILYQIWMFASLGLTDKEKNISFFTGPAHWCCFYAALLLLILWRSLFQCVFY